MMRLACVAALLLAHNAAMAAGGRITPAASTAVPDYPNLPAARAAPAARTAPAHSAETGALHDADKPPYIGVAARIGTLGAALEATLGITEWLNLRAGGNYLQFSDSGSIRDVEYDFDVKLASVPLLVDWHPFKNEFRISGGVIYNRNTANLDSTLGLVTKIGDNYYTCEEIAGLSGSVRFNRWAPYIGLGFGNAVLDAEKTWGFVFDVGIMWHGSPSVELAARGAGSGEAAFQQDLAVETDAIQEETDSFRIYPVISFGISYQF